jgi:hypothetical protein
MGSQNTQRRLWSATGLDHWAKVSFPPLCDCGNLPSTTSIHLMLPLRVLEHTELHPWYEMSRLQSISSWTQRLSILALVSIFPSSRAASVSHVPRWEGIDLIRTVLPTGGITFNLTGKGTLLEALPLGIPLRMPWWTFLVGAIVSFILICRSIFLERKSVEASTFSNITRIIGLGVSVTQSVAGLVHYAHNSYHRSFIQPVNGNAYFALLAAVLSMYFLPSTTFNKMVVPIGLANAAVGMVTFILLALPEIGTAPLYQLSSPYCTTIVTAGFDCGSDYYGNPDFTGAAFYCASTTALAVSENPPSSCSTV